MAGNIIILLLRGDNFDKAVEVISTLNSLPHLIVGVITKEHINEIFELCLAQAHVLAIFVSVYFSYTLDIYVNNNNNNIYIN